MTGHRDEVLPLMVAKAAAAEPDKLIHRSIDHGDITYRELDENSRRWAGALRALGIGRSDCVVTVLPASPTQSCLWVGVGWLRALEAPMNPAYRGDWIANVFEDTKARVAVVHAKYLEPILKTADRLPSLETMIIVGGEVPQGDYGFKLVAAEDVLGAPAEDLPTPERDDIACVIYTSGTTGRSKGVLMTWAQTRFGYDVMGRSFEPPDIDPPIYYLPFGPFHVTGRALYAAVCFGGQVVSREIFSMSSFWSDIKEYGCTCAAMIGATPHFIASQPPREDDADNPLYAVLMAPVIPNIEAFKKRFGIEIFTAYNMSELSSPLTSSEDINDRNYKSCGRIDTGWGVRVVDENGQDTPPHTPGELWVRGEDDPLRVTIGYLAMPEKTKDAFEDGWFKTGDVFTYDEDGYFYFFDRGKDYIRRRGENISSFEVEEAILNFPDAAECAVVAAPADVGEDEVRAIIAPAQGKTIDPVELIKFLEERMPYYAVPRYIDFIDALPRTIATNRVQKHILRDAGVTASTWDREVHIPRKRRG